MTAPLLVFTCHRDTLLPLVESVSKIVVRNKNFPILTNLLVRADAAGKVSVTATDLAITAVASVEGVNVAVAGEICVSADLFRASLAKMPEAPVTIEVGDAGLTMKSGRARAKCLTLPASDFPDVIYRGQSHSFTIPAVDLTTMSDKVGFAISDEETRYYLNGIFLHVTDGHLVAVATDGHRLSKLKLACPEGAETMPGIIVPERVTKLFGLLASKDDNPVEVELSDTFIRFRAARLEITSKLIDGTFPDYSRLIPRRNELVATISLPAIEEAVSRLAIYAITEERTTRWQFAQGSLAVSSKSELGEATDEIEIECEFDLTIGYSAAYVLDIVKSFRGPEIRFHLSDPSSPSLVIDLGDDRREVVLMPLRV